MKLSLLLLLLLLTGCVTTGQFAQKPEEADRVHTDLAVLYYTRRQYNIALEETKLALNYNRDYARAYAIRALIYDALGEEEAAEKDFKRARNLDPNYSENRTNYGIFLCKTNRFQEALSEFEAALANPLYDARGNALLNAGVCAFDHQDMQKAQNYLLAALKENPKPAYAYLMLAKVASANKRYEDALRWLEQFHKVASPTPESLALVRQSLSMIRGK